MMLPPTVTSLGDLEILKLLGSGGSGRVFLARCCAKSPSSPCVPQQERLLALKVMPKSGRSESFHVSAINEQAVLKDMTCDGNGEQRWVTPLVASWHDTQNYYLAMDYIAGGDMAIELMRSYKFEPSRARFYLAELVEAVSQLHSKQIIHRDIKPGNIMFRLDGHLVLGDFGICKSFHHCRSASPTTTLRDSGVFMNEDELDDKDITTMSIEKPSAMEKNDFCMTTEDCGTRLFMSPEQHKGESYSSKVDCWTLGVVLYRMLTGRMPFANLSLDSSEITRAIINQPLSFALTDNIDEVTENILRSLMHKDPSQRLSLHGIKSHPYFDGIDWKLVQDQTYAAPWLPYVTPAPKAASTTLQIVQGEALPPRSDPHPEYTWVRSFESEKAVLRSQHALRTSIRKGIVFPPQPGTQNVPWFHRAWIWFIRLFGSRRRERSPVAMLA